MACLVIAMAACSNNNNGTSSPESSSPAPSSPSATADSSPSASATDNEPVTLKLATTLNEEELKKYQPIFDAFTAKNPSIKVEAMPFLGDMTATLNRGIASGEPVDVFWSDQMWPAFSNGFLEDLTPFIEKDSEFKSYAFNEGLNSSFNFQGHQFGISRGTDTQLVFYNKTLLGELKLEKPALDWSYDDMRELAKKATDPAKDRYAFGNDGQILLVLPQALALANGNAGSLSALNEDFTKSVCDDTNKGCLDDFNFLYDLIHKDGTSLPGPFADKKGYAGQNMWQNGTALFIWGGSWDIAKYSDKSAFPFEWDILPFPKGTKSQPVTARNNGMFMTSQSLHKEEAWKFMSFWATNKDAQKTLMDLGATFPNTTEQDMLDHFKQAPVYKDLDKDALTYIVQHGVYLPTSGMVGGDIAYGLPNGFAGQLWNDQANAYDFLPNATKDVNAQLAAAQERANSILAAKQAGN